MTATQITSLLLLLRKITLSWSEIFLAVFEIHSLLRPKSTGYPVNFTCHDERKFQIKMLPSFGGEMGL